MIFSPILTAVGPLTVKEGLTTVTVALDVRLEPSVELMVILAVPSAIPLMLPELSTVTRSDRSVLQVKLG